MLKPVLFIIIFFHYTSCFSQTAKQSVDYVNVFTGTSNSRWMMNPGPALPLGMVKLGPDNQDQKWCGGYEYTINSIGGFSFIHGMGLSSVSIMPMSTQVLSPEGNSRLFPGSPDGAFGGQWTAGYRSRIRKSEEKGTAGYYSVYLFDSKVQTELTATLRTGVLRFTYPETKEGHIIVNLDMMAEEPVEIKETFAKKVNEHEIEGYIRQKSHYPGDYTVYFVLKLDKAFDSVDGWQFKPYTGAWHDYGDDFKRPCEKTLNFLEFKSGQQSGVVMNFATKKDEQLTLCGGISLVSIDNARLNLETELAPLEYNFDKALANAKNTWNDLLGRVEVSTQNEVDKEKFYTNFYRSYYGKMLASDVNGQYTDMCEKVQTVQAPATAVFSSDGFWGVQWNIAPLWTLVSPEIASQYSSAFVELGRVGGWIPEAPTGISYAPIMGSNHHNAIIISSYQKGIRDFNYKLAFDLIKHDYTTQGIDYPCGGFAGNRHMKPYMDFGFVPDEFGAVSNTVEYAYDDWCLGQFASSLGKKDDYKYFQNRSMNYKNVFDPETKYIRRKNKDGSWVKDFDPFKFGTEGGWNGPGYMEGNAWIYSYFVPQDLPGIINLMGKDEFNKRLEKGFETGKVDLSNQPNLEAPFLFNYSGKPWLTQKYSRMVTDKLIDLDPLVGWLGDEDEGQMSSYYVLLSMGLFEMDGGCSVNPYYDLGSPIFNKVIIHLNSKYYPGGTFTIETKNNSKSNIYLQSAKLNGKLFNSLKLPHAEIVKGGILELEMGDKPNLNFGIETLKHK